MRDIFYHADTKGNYDTLINSLKAFLKQMKIHKMY